MRVAAGAAVALVTATTAAGASSFSLLSPVLTQFSQVTKTAGRSCFRTVDFGGTATRESILRYAGTLLSRVRAPPTVLRPGVGPESLR
ncbi:hypothetical protein PoB_006471400 [Plakobranchus ocellatus]|uniref:Uncharacterized protein n=1 Tax=Plakobranchus ocellatus TaxID=259542 RepID=A0AAV4D247_9GAST|nr:hypothetical protein PoB_006471400 [Plakobranchus ocellatus]